MQSWLFSPFKLVSCHPPCLLSTLWMHHLIFLLFIHVLISYCVTVSVLILFATLLQTCTQVSCSVKQHYWSACSTDYTQLQAPNISHHEPDHSHPLWSRINITLHGSYTLLPLSQPALNSISQCSVLFFNRTYVGQAKYTLCIFAYTQHQLVHWSCLAHSKWLKRHHYTITTVPVTMSLHQILSKNIERWNVHFNYKKASK